MSHSLYYRINPLRPRPFLAVDRVPTLPTYELKALWLLELLARALAHRCAKGFRKARSIFMSGRGQRAKKRSGKGGNAAAKRPCREGAAVRLVQVAEVASSQASSSKDAKAAGADPHGLVGKKCKVPGSWWKETPNDKQLHPCTVVSLLCTVLL